MVALDTWFGVRSHRLGCGSPGSFDHLLWRLPLTPLRPSPAGEGALGSGSGLAGRAGEFHCGTWDASPASGGPGESRPPGTLQAPELPKVAGWGYTSPETTFLLHLSPSFSCFLHSFPDVSSRRSCASQEPGTLLVKKVLLCLKKKKEKRTKACNPRSPLFCLLPLIASSQKREKSMWFLLLFFSPLKSYIWLSNT